MKQKTFSFILILLFAGTKSSAKELHTVTINFQPVIYNEDLRLAKYYYLNDKKDSLKIETLKFYISAIEFLADEKTAWKEENSFHLLDLSKPESMQINLAMKPDISYNRIKFTLGIDSVTNVSGAMGGDLDPTQGMYWTWQSGYIHFKIEGRSNLCKGSVFQYHLGGYTQPNAGFQAITLDVNKRDLHTIFIPLEKFLNQDLLQKKTQIMSPGSDASQMIRTIAANFFVNRP